MLLYHIVSLGRKAIMLNLCLIDLNSSPRERPLDSQFAILLDFKQEKARRSCRKCKKLVEIIIEDAFKQEGCFEIASPLDPAELGLKIVQLRVLQTKQNVYSSRVGQSSLTIGQEFISSNRPWDFRNINLNVVEKSFTFCTLTKLYKKLLIFS